MARGVQRVALTALLGFSNLLYLPVATASTKVNLNLCSAGGYASLGYVLTKGAAAVIHSDFTGTLVGTSSPVESDVFVTDGSNLISQQSPGVYSGYGQIALGNRLC